MRLLFLADAVFQDLPGGSRVVARALAQGLTARGHSVTFLVARHGLDAPGDEMEDGIRIVRYGGAHRAGAFVRAGREACARLWAEAPFDLVHTHFAYAAVGPLQAVPRGVPRVRSFYGPWDAEGWVEDTARLQATRAPAKRLALAARRLMLRQMRHRVEAASLRASRAVIVLSKQSGGEVRAFGYPEDRIHLIPGGADTERFTPALDKEAVRRRLGLPPSVERRILLSVRRLAPRMGLDNLIRAMPQVAARCPDVLLLIGGKGPERAHLEQLINTLQVQAHVRLLGFVPEDDLPAFYQAADAFVLPTVALEGFGLVTVESLACGVPVIGTPVGATPEILRPLEPRLIAPGIGPDALAQTISSFLEAAWSAELTPARLHSYVQQRYTWQRHVQETDNLYRQVKTG